MIVKELKLENFTTHIGTTLTFPPRGVVLVTGPNGSGKSSILEGVSWGAFGEMLRGTTPGDDCCAQLAVEGLLIERSRKKAKTSLVFNAEGRGEVFPTTSKAQESLETLIGSWEVWRRTHVFSSADAAHFTLATDKERKLFLEALLGLGRFDAALGKCRADLHGVERKVVETQSLIQLNTSQRDSALQRKADAERALADLGEDTSLEEESGATKVLEEKQAQLRELMRKSTQELRELHRQIAAASGDTGGADREVALLARRLARLGEAGICESCGQTVPAALREGIEAGIVNARLKALAAAEAAGTATADLKAEVRDIESTLNALRTRESAIAGELEGLRASAGLKRRAAQARGNALATLRDVEQSQKEAEERLAAAEASYAYETHEQVVLEACEQALGLKGARAAILSKLLGGLEAAATVWLQRVAGRGMRLELRSYSEKKSGGVTDAISLQVHGAGAGQGYRATSGGERRRIDIALLLAFAGKGTLFFDEVFDALDGDGAQAVADVLQELARDRCVVVVSHSEDLVSRINAVQHWRVAGGIVRAGA